MTTLVRTLRVLIRCFSQLLIISILVHDQYGRHRSFELFGFWFYTQLPYLQNLLARDLINRDLINRDLKCDQIFFFVLVFISNYFHSFLSNFFFIFKFHFHIQIIPSSTSPPHIPRAAPNEWPVTATVAFEYAVCNFCVNGNT